MSYAITHHVRYGAGRAAAPAPRTAPAPEPDPASDDFDASLDDLFRGPVLLWIVVALAAVTVVATILTLAC